MDVARRNAARQAEHVARTSYGRLLALLVARTRDIAASEDALATALEAALLQWPRDGIPDNPVGWLITVARRSIGHGASRAQTAQRSADTLKLLDDERNAASASPFGDKRLELMFVCAHPAIDPEAQPALMLQTVLGLDAARIAASFLISPAAMGQRLVRAKRKIRDSGISFALPDIADVPVRIDGVLSAIYAAYGTAWEDVAGADSKLVGLAEEAIWLGQLLSELMPEEPEALGLLALMLHCEARRAARRATDGAFVPLHRQDASLWSSSMIVHAEALLRRTAKLASPGRFQTEAAIQSLHAHQRMTGERFSQPLVQLYDHLAQYAPTTGGLVARAVAYAENGHPQVALDMLDSITDIGSYQPWWAARARICWLAGDAEAAWSAASTAAGLAGDASVRQFLLGGGFADSAE
jgi:predicted RNA polymerase sigma factor